MSPDFGHKLPSGMSSAKKEREREKRYVILATVQFSVGRRHSACDEVGEASSGLL